MAKNKKIKKFKSEISEQQYTFVSDSDLQAKYGLSIEDINFLNPVKKELKSNGIIGLRKYNDLLNLRTRYDLFNKNNPDAEFLKLSDIEEKQILIYETEVYRLTKESENKTKIYMAKVRNNVKDEVSTIKGKPFDKKTLYNEFLKAYLFLNKKEFVLNESSILNLEAVIKYLTKDETFFQCKNLVLNIDGLNKNIVPSFEKGLLIVGRFGNGKSSLMKTFEFFINHYYLESIEKKWDNTNVWRDNRFKFENTHNIVSQYEFINCAEDKELFFKKYTNFRYCFDDIKKEKIASNFGNINIMQSLLEKRYDKNSKTFVTMNFDSKSPNNIKDALLEIGIKYGGHLFDRTFEMFNIIEFSGASMRK